MSKRKVNPNENYDSLLSNGIDLFVDEPADKGSDDDDDDTTDSEESVYSGLEEEEEDSEDDDTGESFDELDDENDSSDDDDDKDDDEDGDDDEEDKDTAEGLLELGDDDNSSSGDDDGDDNDDDNGNTLLTPKNHDSTTAKQSKSTISTEQKDNIRNKLKEKKASKTITQSVDNELSDALKAQSVSASEENKTTAKKEKLKSNKNKQTAEEKKSDVNDVMKTNKTDTDKVKDVNKKDEYDYDSSDEEDIRNTVGNIPMEWYKNMDHIGYDIEGRKLVKPKQGDKLDDFLSKADNPNYWRTVTNKMTGQNVVLSKEDVDIVKNLMTRRHPTLSEEELYAPFVDFFTHEQMIHPLSNRPEHKRSFIPSKWEKLRVGQMAIALKRGWMKFSDKEKKEEEEEEDLIPKYYDIWKDENESEINKRFKQHIPAPKMKLPGHEESYNPPPEYLFTKEEEKKWKEKEPYERRINFIPQKFSNLRSVPGYSRFINERFERCLDLYLCPRQRKIRMNVNPEDLIPKLPKPKDLQPFPTAQAILYTGHKDMVRSISVDPSGQWLASGSDDKMVKVWEIITGRCIKTFEMGSQVKYISWNPNPAVCLIACVIDSSIVLLNPGVGDKLQVNNTDNMLNSYQVDEEAGTSQTTWSVYEGEEYDRGLRLKITHNFEVSQVSWHVKGDYFANVLPKGQSKSVCIHQLSRRRSQFPFSKSKGLVQCVKFHPLRPFLFVATQRYVRVYNLLKQEMSKKLTCNTKWVSSMDVHPEGDNVIIGGYDTRLNWFDLDLSTKAYQTLKHHKKAVRSVCYHKKYPLFASAGDDPAVIVSHGMVYNDLLQNPLIVPVKILRGHGTKQDVGVLDCVFHPTQPWIFSSGADATIRLYT